MMMHEVGLPLREPSGEGSDLSTVEMRSFATAAGGALVAWSPARPVRNDASPPPLPFLRLIHILGCTLGSLCPGTPALQSSREEENLHHKHKKREIQHLSCHSVTGINSRGNRHFITSRFQSDVDCRRVNRPTAEYSPGLSTAALVRSQMEVPKTQLKSSACASPEAHVVRRIVQIGAETHDLLGKLDQPTDYGTKLVEAASTDLRCSVPKIHGTGASGRPVPNIVKIAELETCLSEGGSQVFQTEFIHGKIRFLLPPHQPLRTSYAAVHQPHAVLLTNRTTDTMHTTAIRNTKVVSCLAKMSLAQQTTSPINHKHVLPWTADGISKRVRVGLDDRRLTRAVDDQRSNHLIREELPNLNPRNKECVDISVAIEANTHVQAAAKIRITSKPNPRMILNSKFLAPLRSLLLFHHYQRHSKKRMRNAAGQYGSTPASEIPETPTSCTGQWAEVYQSSPEPLNHGHMPLQAPCFLDGTHLNAATALNSQRVSETVFKIEEAEDRAGSKSRKEKLEVLLRLVEGNYEAYQANVLEMRNNFDQFGGQDGSLLYTALGLQAMSRRFRTCKDGIVRQLRIATRETNLSSQLRQARGKVHPERQPLKPNPRGPDLHARLPDSATLILRRWLFEHFLKPYPQHRDKCWLAERTALSRAQVTNWFINARVRLWKPMVEELYGQIQSEDEAGQAAQESSINSGQSSQDGTNNSGSHHTVERDFMLLAGPVRGTRSSA